MTDSVAEVTNSQLLNPTAHPTPWKISPVSFPNHDLKVVGVTLLDANSTVILHSIDRDLAALIVAAVNARCVTANWQAGITEDICGLKVYEGSDYGWAFVERLDADTYDVIDQTDNQPNNDHAKAKGLSRENAIATVLQIGAAEFERTAR